ncbi:MAG: hypothetical protein WDO13_12460 [Verrucomicrobiota bacterium]
MGLASLVFLLLLGHIVLAVQVGKAQNQVSLAQSAINQGNVFGNDLKQLAVRIFQDSQRTGDPGLKDLLARQQITYTPSTNATEAPATPSAGTTH